MLSEALAGNLTAVLDMRRALHAIRVVDLRFLLDFAGIAMFHHGFIRSLQREPEQSPASVIVVTGRTRSYYALCEA